MLPIIICEDNTEMLNRIQKIVSDILLIEDLDAQLYNTYTSSDALLSVLSSIPTPTLYLLDIEFPGETDGFTLARHIRTHDSRGFIAFITTHENWSPLAFKHRLEAMDYIWKDSPENISVRIKECILEAYERYTSKSNKNAPNLIVKNPLGHRIVPIDSIYAVTTCEKPHTLRIYTDTSILETRQSLSQIHSELGNSFWQCHKSCIIASNRLESIDKRSKLIYLNNKSSFPLSVKYLKELNTGAVT